MVILCTHCLRRVNANLHYPEDLNGPAQATVDTAGSLYGHKTAVVVRQVFVGRGILGL